MSIDWVTQNVLAAKNCTTTAIFYFTCTGNHGIIIELKRLLRLLAVFSQLVTALQINVICGLRIMFDYISASLSMSRSTVYNTCCVGLHYNEKRLSGRLPSCQPFLFWRNASHYGPGLWFTIRSNCTTLICESANRNWFLFLTSFDVFRSVARETGILLTTRHSEYSTDVAETDT